jgi:hypothetical protein
MGHPDLWLCVRRDNEQRQKKKQILRFAKDDNFKTDENFTGDGEFLS